VDKGKSAGQKVYTFSLQLWVSVWVNLHLTQTKPFTSPYSTPCSWFILINLRVIHSYPQVTPTLGVFRYLIFSLGLNSGGQFVDLVINRAALSHQLTDLAIGVHNRGVVAAAEGLTNLRQR